MKYTILRFTPLGISGSKYVVVAENKRIIFIDEYLKDRLEIKNENDELSFRWIREFPSNNPSVWFRIKDLWVDNNKYIFEANSDDEALCYFKLIN